MQESRGAIAESDYLGNWTADTSDADCESFTKGPGNLALLVKPINVFARNDSYIRLNGFHVAHDLPAVLQ